MQKLVVEPLLFTPWAANQQTTSRQRKTGVPDPIRSNIISLMQLTDRKKVNLLFKQQKSAFYSSTMVCPSSAGFVFRFRIFAFIFQPLVQSFSVWVAWMLKKPGVQTAVLFLILFLMFLGGGGGGGGLFVLSNVWHNTQHYSPLTHTLVRSFMSS